MLTRQIEKAQRKVEAHNFDIRKQLLLFDDVANDQRKVVYAQRTEILGTDDLSDAVKSMYEEAVLGLVDAHLPVGSAPQSWDLSALNEALQRDFGGTVDVAAWIAADPQLEDGAVRTRVVQAVLQGYEQKVERLGPELMRHIERDVVLRQLDQHWRDHLAAMDYLRQGIHLRGYAQKDYRYEYKREAFELFTAMLGRVKYDVASTMSKIEVRTQEQIDRDEAERRERLMRALQAQHAEMPTALNQDTPAAPEAAAAGAAGSAAPLMGAEGPAGGAPFVRGDRKIGRNEPCPCGSGRKYKQCHGLLE
jgi:preprotein translocase subunit SecA